MPLCARAPELSGVHSGAKRQTKGMPCEIRATVHVHRIRFEEGDCQDHLFTMRREKCGAATRDLISEPRSCIERGRCSG
ncbi:hypothetical protein PUN28_017471 [Cardiocondyla obscurior]|uniref:Uncharacterized protein n=1 Tax=Cardiocondyla obscurior TaxID=286306 RepID=A0AAW2EMU0_9HYME